MTPSRAAFAVHVTWPDEPRGLVEARIASPWNLELVFADATLAIKLPLPVSETHKLETQRKSGATESLAGRLALSERDRAQLSDTYLTRNTPEAVDLSPLHSVTCRCGARLVAPGSIERVTNLPSEQWVELMDCWLCHYDTKFAADMPQRLLEGRVPRGTLQVGEVAVRLNPLDAVSGSVQLAAAPEASEGPRMLSLASIFIFYIRSQLKKAAEEIGALCWATAAA